MHLHQRTLLVGLVTLPLVVAAACSSSNSTSDDGAGGEAGMGAAGGEVGTSGRGGSSGSSGSSGSATGGSSGSGAAGGGAGGAGGSGAEGGSGPEDCADAQTLPRDVETDTTVGPGCVRIDRTSVIEGATLTIEPGTTVLMAPGAFLDAGGSSDNASIVALGTEAEPIVFTSEATNPAPGDWQCVRIGGASAASEFRYTTFEYGGAPCESTGADYEGMLQLDAGARGVSDSTFRQSLTHGVLIQRQGGVREFENNQFSDNEAASINVAAPQLLVLGEGLEFSDPADRIEVDTTFSLASSGTWLGQPVPFRIAGSLAIGGNSAVTIGAGAVLEIDGTSIEVFMANLIVAGTAAAPVTFTSSRENPVAGDWGCIHFSSVTGTPRFEHALLEYAGNGGGCTGADYETALVVPETTVITNTTFKDIAGTAVLSRECNVEDWCENTFENVEVGPLACDIGQLPTACP
jgi:hypothetical protein